MIKVIWGFIKFYIVYMLFGAMALIIIYASADLKCLINTDESFFQTLIHAPDSIDEDMAISTVEKFILIAFESVPGDTFLDAVLGISFETNVGADITSLVVDLFQSGETLSVLAKNLQNYKFFWRDMAVATCASMVLYAVAHFKSRIVGKGLPVWLGFAFASIFWIFAAYTFSETIVYAVEARVNYDNFNILYIIITATAILLEASIHAYGGKCSLVRLVALLCLKIFFNLLRSAFMLYICKVFVSFFNIENVSTLVNIPLNTFGIITSVGIVVCTVFIEAKVTKWSEKVLG